MSWKSSHQNATILFCCPSGAWLHRLTQDRLESVSAVSLSAGVEHQQPGAAGSSLALLQTQCLCSREFKLKITVKLIWYTGDF